MLAFGYLFNHKALEAVFRAKLLVALNAQGLAGGAAVPARALGGRLQERGQW